MSFKESNPRSCRLDPPYPLPKRKRNSVRICLTAPSMTPDISPRQYRTAHQSGRHTTLLDMESVHQRRTTVFWWHASNLGSQIYSCTDYLSGFSFGPVRASTQAGHRMLYTQTEDNDCGVIENLTDVLNILPVLQTHRSKCNIPTESNQLFTPTSSPLTRQFTPIFRNGRRVLCQRCLKTRIACKCSHETVRYAGWKIFIHVLEVAGRISPMIGRWVGDCHQ